jgi:hypothetical protein
MAAAGSWRGLEPPLSPKILEIIEETLKFHNMTPVQAATLPKFLQHKDVAVEVRRFPHFTSAGPQHIGIAYFLYYYYDD